MTLRPAMNRSRTYVLGGVGAIVLGAACLDFFPPFALLEVVAGTLVLIARRSAASLTALLPTALILASAIKGMVTVSGPANPLMLSVAVACVLVAAGLLRGGAVRAAEHAPR